MIYHVGRIDRVGVIVALLLFSAKQVGADTCTAGTALTGGTEHCSSNASGSMSGGYTWTIWSSGSGGCITTYTAGCAFKATWNNSGDFLARTGLGWNSTQTYTQLGEISADFAETKTGTGGGYSYIGIYGWSKDPLCEYYIVDDWFNLYRSGTKKGTFTIEGEGTYDVYQNTQTNQPSIVGTSTFQQYFSFRQTARQCGHISISKHFRKWDSLGMTLGKMYEARILAEAGGGSGSLDFTKATLVVGSSPVSYLSETSRGRVSSLDGWKGNGIISVFSLNGALVKSIRQTASQPAVVSTDNLSRGLYLIQFQGDGKAPVGRSLFLK
jgi:hypothetical protein